MWSNICNVTFEISACTSRASRHRDTLEHRPNLQQAGDPIEKHTDLLKYGYIIVVQNLLFSLDRTACIWNSAFEHTAWSTSLSPRVADDAGLAQFDFTRPASREKLARACSWPGGGGDCDRPTCRYDNVVTWQRGLRLLSIQTLNCFSWAEYWLLWKKWWHHVIIGIKHDRPAWRDNTCGSLTPTIHTQSCLIP